MPDGVDAKMNRVQPTGVDPELDPPSPAAEAKKLHARYDSMLPIRQLCHRGIRSASPHGCTYMGH
jgi:hypothetical protein